MLRPCPKREIGRRKNTKNNCELRPLLRLFARALVHSFPRSLASRALYHDLDRQALDPRHSQLLTHAVGYHRVLQAAHHHRGREWRWQDGARARASIHSPQPLLTHLQTVIECLNYATTGEHPPCSQKGQAFVHDPKVGAYARSAHCWLARSLVGWLVHSRRWRWCRRTRLLATPRFLPRYAFASATSTASRSRVRVCSRCSNVRTSSSSRRSIALSTRMTIAAKYVAARSPSSTRQCECESGCVSEDLVHPNVQYRISAYDTHIHTYS